MKVDGVILGTDQRYYVRALLRDESLVFLEITPGKASEPLNLGQSIREIVTPPRADDLLSLVDPAPIKAALAELQSQGWKITWVSLSTALLGVPGADEPPERVVEVGELCALLHPPQVARPRAGGTVSGIS